KGSASKEDCLLAVERRFPEARVQGTDDADAFTLLAMGMDWAGCPLAILPAAQRAVLTARVAATKQKPAHPAIEWPELRKAALWAEFSRAGAAPPPFPPPGRTRWSRRSRRSSGSSARAPSCA